MPHGGGSGSGNNSSSTFSGWKRSVATVVTVNRSGECAGPLTRISPPVPTNTVVSIQDERSRPGWKSRRRADAG